jgi:two-component system phosphate regulon sensor histidine kinase PhoR
VNLSDLLSRSVTVFKPQAAEKNVSLNLNAATDLPLVWVDPQRLEQVIGNVIDNALRYTNENGAITIEAEPVEGGARVSIADNGVGVPEEEIDKIFDRFWRNEKAVPVRTVVPVWDWPSRGS